MSLSNALSYLTVLPIPFKKHLPLARSVHFFPLVGAGMGSLLVLAQLGLRALLPSYLACLATIGLLEAMTGGIHLRAVAEMAEGRRTFPGSGFGPEAKYGWRGMSAVAFMVVAKAVGLFHMRWDWQPFAVLLVPILGRSSQALGIIFSRQRLAVKAAESRSQKDPTVQRRRIRALLFMAVLFSAVFLFPWQAALALIAGYAALVMGAYRFFNSRMDGLTVQTLGTVAEMAEAGFLVGCALLSAAPY